jgi:hypothetical protein
VKRVEQTLNKPIVVLVVGVVAVALNVMFYVGYHMSGTPLTGHTNSIGASLPEVIGKSEPKARSDSEPVSKSDAEASSKSGPEKSLEADPALFSSPSPVSVLPQASASAQSSASAQASASAQVSPGPPPPPQQQSVIHSSAEVSISQDESAGATSSIDPSSSCPYWQSKLKGSGLGCTHVTVPLPKATAP